MAAFVGRDAELAQLHAWADEASATGVGRFVLVTGEPGVGKTQLCSEFSRGIRTTVAPVAWSRCWVNSGGPALWPWPDLLTELARRRPGVPAPPATTSSQDRYGYFQALTDELRELCAAAPAVALIDDLHLANSDVVLLTRFVARSLHRYPLLLVATWRVDSTATAGMDSRLRALARDGTTLHLGPFGPDEVAAYLRQAGRETAGPAEISRLIDLTGGNPLYLTEVLASPGGAAGPGRAGLASALRERVDRIPRPRRRILGAIALLGEQTTPDEVARVLGCSATEVAEAIGHPGSGASVKSGRIRLAHELVREALIADMPPADRQQVHIAAASMIRGAQVGQVVRRAHHAVEAVTAGLEQRAGAVAACAEAAAALQGALGFEQALTWAARGAELAAGYEPAATEAEMVLAQASATLACGRLGEARELYGRAVEPADRAGDPRFLALAALGLGGVWVEEQRDEMSRRRMLALCRRALAELPVEEELLAARLRVRLAAEHAYGGSTVEDVRVAVEHVRCLGDPAATAEALSLYHHTLLLPGEATTRLAVSEELLDTAAQVEGTIYDLFGLCWRTVDLYLGGDTGADRAFVDLRERATALGSQSIGYIVAVLDVMRTFRRGDLVAAEQAAERALRLGLAVGDADALGYYSAHMLTIRWIQGRLGEMVQTVTSVLESATLRRRDRIFPAVLACATAWRGDHSAARSVLDGLLADGVDAIPTFSTWAATLAVLVEAAAELGDGDLADQLAARLSPYASLPVMPSLAVVCLGPGERTMGVAAATAGRLDDAIAWFRSALTANRRLRNRPLEALIRAQLADALCRRRAPGDRQEARDLYAAAVDLGRALGLSGRLPAWEAAAAMSEDPLPIVQQQGALERREHGWYVEVAGRSTTVRNLVGMRHLAELLARPDVDIPATQLAAAVTGNRAVAATAPGPHTLDGRALAGYRRRLTELDRELDAADLTGDAGRSRHAIDERTAILAALRRDTGLGGRPRRIGDDAERTRMRVSKAIHRAIAELSSADRVIGSAFETGVHTGHLCRYASDPGHPISWTVRT